MTKKVSTCFVASKLQVSSPTVNRLVKSDKNFPRPVKIGRVKYFNLDALQSWLQSRVVNDGQIEPHDKIMSGSRLLELTGRSKTWLWSSVIKPKTLTRINLSPDPSSNKLINFFIEREVYEVFGDLIDAESGGDE